MPDLHVKANGSPCALFNVHQHFFNSFGDPNFVIFTWHEPKHQRSKFKAAVLTRLLRLLFVSCFSLYLAVCVVVAIFQRRLLYLPPVYTSKQVEQFARTARLERWKDPSGQAIGMKRLSHQQPAAGRVLIVYGNGSCATACAHYADVIQDVAALDVFIVEYPGYADRPGSPSQKSLFRAADEAFKLLATNKPVCCWASRSAPASPRIWPECILTRSPVWFYSRRTIGWPMLRNIIIHCFRCI